MEPEDDSVLDQEEQTHGDPDKPSATYRPALEEENEATPESEDA